MFSCKKHTLSVFWVGLCASVLLSQTVTAETAASQGITTTSTSINLFDTENGTQRLIVPVPTNSYGVSLSQFQQFDTRGTPIKVSSAIIDHTDDDVDNAPDSVVIIQAPTITLDSQFELLGAPADLIFHATSNVANAFQCFGCSFKNFDRVSIITGPATILDSAGDIQPLRTNSAASISVTYLNAPGVVSLDLVSSNINVSGTIDATERLSKSLGEGYIRDTSGSLVSGTGEISLIMGDISWLHAGNEITEVFDTAQTETLSGTFHAASISAIAGGNLEVIGDFNTLVDLYSSVTYRGNVFVPRSEINLMAFGDMILSNDGSYQSEGKIKAFSNGTMLMSKNIDLPSADINLVSKGLVMTRANFSARNVSVAGGAVDNSRFISASENIEIWAEELLQSRYGAKLAASHIALKSKNGIVRNGSRVPFADVTIDSSEQISTLRREREIIGYTPSYYYGFCIYNCVPFPIYGDLEEINDIYMSNPKTGTYSFLGEEIAQSWENSSKTLQRDLSASILANSISIEAHAFENINPYFELAHDEEFFFFEPIFMDQVRVVAETSLKIKASSYCLNSSSQLVLSSSSGSMELDCNLLTNEVYRSESKLVTNLTETSTTTTSGYQVNETDMSELELGTEHFINSPPAILRSFGSLHVKASGGLVSNLSFFEVYGNALLDVSSINIIGLENKNYGYLESNKKKYRRYQSYCSSRSYERGRCNREWRQYLTSTSKDILVTESDPIELGTLFLVQGNLTANAAEGWFYNHKPLTSYTDQAVDYFLENTLGVQEGTHLISEPISMFQSHPKVYQEVELDTSDELLREGYMTVDTTTSIQQATSGGWFQQTVYGDEYNESSTSFIYTIIEIFTEFLENVVTYVKELWDSIWD